MIFLLAFINLSIYLIQLLLGLIAIRTRKIRSRKFSFPTGSQIEPNHLIEKYFYDESYEFEIKATDEIDEPAEATEDFLWVNKKVLNKSDLYSNFYLIYQAELTSSKYKFLRMYNSIQATIFFLKLIFIIVGIMSGGFVGLIILFLTLFTNLVILALWIVAYNQQTDAINKSKEVALAVMKLDDVEVARLNALTNDLRYELLEYPWEIFWRLWVFFTP
ncbi:hypothetical protein D6810_02395 [Candidatus Dojkabacteria bacterium]|uniref:Uncharacterized protein n=1 Tax=Candidatus Dojkabacteria bacterium TaxID=2099670 RepID=A0A3M0YXX3_9BACT|nr:MAG: hypothetical protein D6810_02395 [Candidatus Dojkabacteria bacterium]